MSLRRQLLAASLLLLCLPWAGCQFVREIESTLRRSQADALQSRARATADLLARDNNLAEQLPRTTADSAPVFYAHRARQPVIVDGYADGWPRPHYRRLSGGREARAFAVHYQGAVRHGRLYVLLHVRDADPVYSRPDDTDPNRYDHVTLALGRDGRQRYRIHTAAPGSVETHPAGDSAAHAAWRIQGYWQDAADGYTLELELPLELTGGHFGFAVHDATADGDPAPALGTFEPGRAGAPPRLVHPSEPLSQALHRFAESDTEMRILDGQGWIVAEASMPQAPDASTAADEEVFWLLRVLYRSVLSRDGEPLPENATPGRILRREVSSALDGTGGGDWYELGQGAGSSLLSVAQPLQRDGRVVGALLMTQGSETYLSLTDRAFSRLLFYSATGLGLAIAALLGYASLLSWRIRRLSRATARVIGAEGIAAARFPRSGARDEIGELSRRYGALLDQLQDYHDYLRSLSRTLSHELRTPIAVIRTSLENLEQETPRSESEYLQRARQGLDSLNQILTAMSEANRLEESLQGNTPRRLDLVPLLQELAAAYRPVYPDHSLILRCDVAEAPARAVPELIAQALDKLVDNAASFAPPGSEIRISLAAASGGGWEIAVSNPGPTLPEEMRRQIFDPMVSLREKRDGKGVNLGLGLHIVRLIADYHSGSVHAENWLRNHRAIGVRMCLRLPPDTAPGDTGT